MGIPQLQLACCMVRAFRLIVPRAVLSQNHIGVISRSCSSLASTMSVSKYVGEYFFGGNRARGSIYVTEAGKTKSGADYNAPVDDAKDFPEIVQQQDLKDALWVWLRGNNGHNGDGWYLHDTIYKVKIESH